MAPNGHLFPAPAWADFHEAYVAGSLAGSNWFTQNIYFGHWGMFDFQRSGSTFINAYQPAASYAVGVGMFAAGYSRQDAIDHVALFAGFMSSNSGDAAPAYFQGLGWDAGASGACNVGP